MEEIESSLLTPELIPGLEAYWEEIFAFALTFDGYRHCGSFENCARIAHEKRHDTLDDLRTCLFFEQRVWHGQDEIPQGEHLENFRYLVQAIRDKVASK